MCGVVWWGLVVVDNLRFEDRAQLLRLLLRHDKVISREKRAHKKKQPL